MAKYTDLNEKALETLLFQFRHKDNFRALAQSLARQEFEDEYFALAFAYGVDEANGKELDTLGKWVQEARGTFTDPEYRDIIKAKIKALSSTGTAPELVELLAFITGFEVEFSEGFPAGFRLQYVGNFPEALEARAARLIQIAKADGVAFDVVYGRTAGVFRFGGPSFGSPLGSKWT